MKDDRARLRRVRLIERMRSAQKQQAAAEAHHAELVRQKLETLSYRTRSLAQVYAIRDHAIDAADLRGASLLSAHLRELGRTAEAQARAARETADAKMTALAAAERRRQRAETDRREVHQAIVERLNRPETVPVRRIGMDIE